eukprot:NODE_78_length_23230_cov_1.644979.p7 type:complete len:337 gc:universal NODE_78_length_23230_cov_1.644979:2418-3428(+)
MHENKLSVEKRAMLEIDQLLHELDGKAEKYYQKYIKAARQQLKKMEIEKSNELVLQIKQAHNFELPDLSQRLELDNFPIFNIDYKPTQFEHFDQKWLSEMPQLIKYLSVEIEKSEQQLIKIGISPESVWEEHELVGKMDLSENICDVGSTELQELEKTLKNLKLDAASKVELLNCQLQTINDTQRQIKKCSGKLNRQIEELNLISEKNYEYIRENDLSFLLENNGIKLLEEDENRLLFEKQLQDILKILNLNPFSSKNELLAALEYDENDPLLDFDPEELSHCVNYEDFVNNVNDYNENAKEILNSRRIQESNIDENIAAIEFEIEELKRIRSITK